MKYAVDTSIQGIYSNPKLIGDLAVLAEHSGWDGFFIWDSVGVEEPIADPWVTLSVIASLTEKIRIGTAVTPIARRRPWKLARETVSVDNLSSGRLTLGVGLGASPTTEYERFGEDPDTRILARKLDEGLDVLTGLWSGKEFSYLGDHYRIDQATFLPKPVQTPRIPIWVGANWPNKRPLRRAAQWDGVYPIYWHEGENKMSPTILKDIVKYVGEHKNNSRGFDVVAAGTHDVSKRSQLAQLAKAYSDIGATWYASPIGPHIGDVNAVKAWISLGPPKY